MPGIAKREQVFCLGCSAERDIVELGEKILEKSETYNILVYLQELV
jgi:hypothetical protein